MLIFNFQFGAGFQFQPAPAHDSLAAAQAASQAADAQVAASQAAAAQVMFLQNK